MLQPTIVLHRAATAELFYDETRFQRAGAAPELLRATLFGKGTVQSLDDAAHRQRKALFLVTTGSDAVAALVADARRTWHQAVVGRAAHSRVVLYDLAREVLTRAVCAWAGVPLAEHEVALRTQQLTLLFDGAARGAAAHLRSRGARGASETWLATQVRATREGSAGFPAGSVARQVALHSGLDGELPPPRVAAAELLNLLRTTVAVAVFIMFAAHALHTNPVWRSRLRNHCDRADIDAFVEKTRRYYPFFPATVAKVRRAFEWNGCHFAEGRRTMLDLYGTNHDARRWTAPDRFEPARFLSRRPTPYDLIPQGGSDAAHQHRCPGEGIKRALMAQAVELLTGPLETIVAAQQDLRIDFQRLPALARHGFVLERLRWVGDAEIARA